MEKFLETKKFFQKILENFTAAAADREKKMGTYQLATVGYESPAFFYSLQGFRIRILTGLSY
jgi:hypothetical protein